MKNKTGSVKPLETMTPQVGGSFKRSRHRGRGFRTVSVCERPARIIWRSVSLRRGWSCGKKYILRQTTSHKNPNSPGIAKATRHPKRKYNGKIRNGAMAPPTDEPLSYNAAASPRSRSGNHSETALQAPGQLADSPAPSRKRNRAKLEMPLASEVKRETIEYQVTLMVSPRRVPTRSISRPHTPCPIA